MMSEKIILKGITRSQSERATGKGNCSESLNAYVSYDEIAPALAPVSVGSKYGINNVYGDIIYIHNIKGKSSNTIYYKNNIVYSYYGSSETSGSLFTLESGETINGTECVGNTMIVSTDKHMHYLLFKDGKYKYLGTKVPFPKIIYYAWCNDTFDLDETESDTKRYRTVEYDKGTENAPIKIVHRTTPYEKMWMDASTSALPMSISNKIYKRKIDDDNYTTIENQHGDSVLWLSDKSHRRIVEQQYNAYKSVSNVLREDGSFLFPIMFKYSVKLYSGEHIDSTPTLVGFSMYPFLMLNTQLGITDVSYCIVPAYKIHVRLDTTDSEVSSLEDWSDIIDSINFFASTDIDCRSENEIERSMYLEKMWTNYTTSGSTVTTMFGVGRTYDFEKEILSKSVFYNISKITIKDNINSESLSNDYYRLKSGYYLDTKRVSGNDGRISSENGSLPNGGTYMSQHVISCDNISAFNHRLLMSGIKMKLPSKVTPYALNYFAFQPVESERKNATELLNSSMTSLKYNPSDMTIKSMTFYIRGYDGNVYSTTTSYGKWDKPPINVGTAYDAPAFLTYPDPRCFKVDVAVTFPTSWVAPSTLLLNGEDSLNGESTGESGIGGDNANEGVNTDYGDNTSIDNAEVTGNINSGSSDIAYDNPNLDFGNGDIIDGDAGGGNSGSVGDDEVDDENETITQIISIPMKEHPYLSCSYYFGGALSSSLKLSIFDHYKYNERTLDNLGDTEYISNKLFQTGADKPFTVPVGGRHTVSNGNIIGFGIATMALSEGQFGKFPVYVLTDDGIWTMETNSDGTLGSKIPMDRDVCSSAKSITQLDNALAFFSKSGVMMIQGSNVTNISLDMDGKHINLDEDVAGFIEQNDSSDKWTRLIDDASDSCSFLEYIENAYMSYDYSGSRLIIYRDDKTYAYVYCISSQTWHKLSISDNIKLHRPINGYPECLIVSTDSNGKKDILDMTMPKNIGASSVSSLNTVIETRAFDMDKPDLYKSVSSIRIRGVNDIGDSKYILLGSNDYKKWTIIKSLRGLAFKVFKLVILATLSPTERITGIEIEYDDRTQNRMR